MGLPRANPSVSHPESTGEIAGAGAASLMSALTDKALVKKELLYEVAGRDRYQVNNKHDGKYSPLPPSKIVQRAEELVGQEVLYKLTSENCEHFVNELRYGVARSDQVCAGRVRVPGNLTISSSDLDIGVGSAGWRRAKPRGTSRTSPCPGGCPGRGAGGGCGWGEGCCRPLGFRALARASAQPSPPAGLSSPPWLPGPEMVPSHSPRGRCHYPALQMQKLRLTEFTCLVDGHSFPQTKLRCLFS